MQNNLPFAGLLLVSDLDGTLINRDFVMPERNKFAVERFVRLGGRFTFATGRTQLSALRFERQLSVNAPAILYNGAVLYDFAAGRFISKTCLPQSSMTIVRRVLAEMPDVGVELFAHDDFYIVNETPFTENHIDSTIKGTVTGLENAPDEIIKVLFAAPPDRLKQVEDFVNSIKGKDIRGLYSHSYFYEILRSDCSKGSALHQLAEILKIDHENVMAIGDYYNDLELLQSAGHAAMPAEAPDELKKLADITVCRCEDGAVADFIEYIEKTTG